MGLNLAVLAILLTVLLAITFGVALAIWHEHRPRPSGRRPRPRR